MSAPFTTSDIIAISGHRDFPDPGSLYRGLDNLRAREYIFGGARGTDTQALEYLSRTQPASVRTVVVPNTLGDQPASTIPVTQHNASRVIELHNTGSDRFFIRNRYMVDHSTHLRAFYDGRGRGGTFQSMNYAKSIGRSYDVWPLNSYDLNEVLSMSKGNFNNFFLKMRANRINLSSVKGIFIRYIKDIRQVPVSSFLSEVGFPGYKSIESMW